MRTSESERPGRVGTVLRRIVLTVATGSVTFALTNLTNEPLFWTLTLSVLIGGVTLLAQFLVDFERRQELVEQRMHSLEQSNTAVVQRIEDIVKHEIARFNETARLLDRLTDSALQADSVLKLVRLSADLSDTAPTLAHDVAQAQVDTTVSFLEQLSHGGEINYEGEDRDWLLTLTNRARHAICATSRGTASADGRGFVDEGFWDSELGNRFLEAQRDATRRGVVIRRIFILEHGGLTADTGFRKLCDQQHNAGISVRTLDASTLTPARTLLIPDLAIFDEEISYELTTGPRLGAAPAPYFVKTLLVVRPHAVHDRVRRFNDYWELSEPYT